MLVRQIERHTIAVAVYDVVSQSYTRGYTYPAPRLLSYQSSSSSSTARLSRTTGCEECWYSLLTRSVSKSIVRTRKTFPITPNNQNAQLYTHMNDPDFLTTHSSSPPNDIALTSLRARISLASNLNITSYDGLRGSRHTSFSSESTIYLPTRSFKVDPLHAGNLDSQTPSSLPLHAHNLDSQTKLLNSCNSTRIINPKHHEACRVINPQIKPQN